MPTPPDTSAIALAHDKPIAGFETLYSVTSAGQIIRHARQAAGGRGIRNLKERALNPVFRSGYRYVCLTNAKGVVHQIAVHQIVCQAFHGSAPLKGMEPNHKNGDKQDNTASNLEWMTRSQNQRHAADTGLKPVGEKSHLAKLTAAAVREIRRMAGSCSQRQIAAIFNISQTQVSRITSGQDWKQLSA